MGHSNSSSGARRIDVLVSDIVHRNAEFFGESDALVVPDGVTRSWGETELRSNQLANALIDLGLTKGDRVAAFASNGPEYVEFFFACAKSGIVGAAANIRLAPTELASYLRYVEPIAIVVSADQAEVARRFIADVPSLKHVVGFGGDHGFELDYEALVGSGSTTVPPVSVDDDDIYQLGSTSGTTGVPKGAILTHRNAIAAMMNWITEMPIAEGDTYLQCIPMFFNPGGPAQLHPVMMKGGRSIIYGGFEPGAFLRAIPRFGVTHTTAVPTMIGMALDHPECAEHDLSSVRAVVTGGSPVPRELLLRAQAVFGPRVFYPFFGMAETYSCGMALRPENQHPEGTDEDVRRLSSAGKPHALMQIRVADDDGHDVPNDNETPGELWLRGDSVSPGYFRMEEETICSRTDGWFKSGDIAVRDDGDYVTIVDRKKDMIITGGINVFTRDVEEALYGHRAVAQCAVIGVPHKQWGEAIHAVVVLRDGAEATPEELTSFAADRLAGYKKPRSLEIVDVLPIGGTGKILKRELRSMYEADSDAD
jgi:acyl-CoA synthetase (AMP-forming)/AMP-acid ligase II